MLPVLGSASKRNKNSYFVAEIVATPSAIVVAKPLAVIDTIDESELLQATDGAMSFPKLSRAINCNWLPLGRVWFEGVKVSELTVACTPVPNKLIMIWEFAALLLMAMLPKTLLAANGAKVAFTLVLCPGTKIIPLTSAALNPGPEIVTVEIVTSEFPKIRQAHVQTAIAAYTYVAKVHTYYSEH
jgi:hypothetical protein